MLTFSFLGFLKIHDRKVSILPRLPCHDVPKLRIWTKIKQILSPLRKGEGGREGRQAEKMGEGERGVRASVCARPWDFSQHYFKIKNKPKNLFLTVSWTLICRWQQSIQQLAVGSARRGEEQQGTVMQRSPTNMRGEGRRWETHNFLPALATISLHSPITKGVVY